MILVVDGNNLGHRIFHTPGGELTKKDGTPSGVVLGVIKSVKGMLDKFPETTRVIVTWDAKGGSAWRKAIYPSYKGNRDYGKEDEEKKEKYEGLFKQMQQSHEMLHLLGVHSIKVEGYEADDMMAIISRTAKEVTGSHVMVVTSDKDMLQLVNDDVSVYSPYRDKIISPLNFYEETGVTPEAYIGYRALVGDTSDNIHGIEGIAEGRAKKLMDEFGHINNVLNATGDARKKLEKSKIFRRIFEPSGLRILGINNKIMNFDFVEVNDELSSAVTRALTEELRANSKEFKQWCMEWQFVSILANYLPFITPFNSLGED